MEEWVVDRSGGKLTLKARNSAGCYVLVDHSTLEEASQSLSKREIDKIVTPPEGKEAEACSCRTGVGIGRCFQKFNFNDVRALRSEQFTVANYESVLSQRLKALQQADIRGNRGSRGSRGSQGNLDPDSPIRTITYYLNTEMVCRTYFGVCLDLGKKALDRVSNLARGITHVPVPRQITYNPNTTKHNKCLVFWRTFFGEQAQMSDEHHRYFPVNMSYFYIYMHDFFPWWKNTMGDWAALPITPPLATTNLLPQVSAPGDAISYFRFLTDEADPDSDEDVVDFPNREPSQPWQPWLATQGSRRRPRGLSLITSPLQSRIPSTARRLGNTSGHSRPI